MDKFKLINGKDKTFLTDIASAKSNYDAGYRAYSVFGNMTFKSPHGENIQANNDELIIEWDSLRAYQDEQRKKGVPIDCPSDQIMTWLGKSYAEFTFYFFEFSHPVIHNCPEKGKSIGRFTNFRWREGYPKETKKQTI